MVKSRRFCLGTTTLLGLGVASFGLTAQRVEALPEQTQPTRSAAESDLCHDAPNRDASALTFLACSLRDSLPPLERTTVVVSRPLTEASAEGSRAFAARLTLLLSNATAARDGGVAVSNPADAAAVLLLEPQLHGTLIQVNATLVGRRAGIWARLRGETHQVLAHAFVSKPLDTELQSYLPAVPLVRPAVAFYPSPISQPNAIACGDIDADGALELAVASRRDVAIGALRFNGFVPSHVAALSSLSEVAPAPLREPLASLWFHGAALEASTTDRRHWLELGATLQPITKRANQWGIGPGLCVARDTDASALTFDCGHAPKLSDATSPSFDRVVATGERREQRVLLSRDAHTTALTIRTATRTWTLPDRGAQAAIGDLNRDGTIEVVSTSPSLARGDDRITVHSLSKRDAPVLLWELPVSTGVDAVALCPMTASTQSAIVFASNDRIGVALPGPDEQRAQQ